MSHLQWKLGDFVSSTAVDGTCNLTTVNIEKNGYCKDEHKEDTDLVNRVGVCYP